MKWNEIEDAATRKHDGKETVEPYTGWTDQRGKRKNEWSRYIYLYYIK